MADQRRHPLLIAAIATGIVCVGLAMVTTMSYANAFAHPARVAKLGGAIPEATVRGAEFFRIALAAGAILIPLLTWQLVGRCAPSPNRAPSIMPNTRARWLWLLVVCAVGAFMRVALASQSLWYDEISAFLSFAIEGPSVAFGSYAVPTNHVPMTIAMWLAWTLTDSTAELVLRAPALIAGIAAIPVAYALAGTLFGQRAAIAGAAVIACAPIAVLESAEARGYPFVILGALVAALALARAEITRAASDYALFAVACAFAAWSHPVAILVPICAGIVGLWRDHRLALAALLAGVITTVLLSPLAGDVLATRASYTHISADQPTIFSREGFEAMVGLALAWSGRGDFFVNYILVGIASLSALRLLRERSKQMHRARLVLLPFALAFLLAFALAFTLGTWIYARFLLFSIPIGTVLLVIAVLAREERRWIAWMTSALLLVGALISIASFRSKQPIRDGVELVAHARALGADGAIATIGLPDNAVGFYARLHGFEAKPTGFLGESLARVIESDHPRFIIVLYPDRLDRLTATTLADGYHRTDRLEGWADWGQGAVEVWQRSP